MTQYQETAINLLWERQDAIKRKLKGNAKKINFSDLWDDMTLADQHLVLEEALEKGKAICLLETFLTEKQRYDVLENAPYSLLAKLLMEYPDEIEKYFVEEISYPKAAAFFSCSTPELLEDSYKVFMSIPEEQREFRQEILQGNPKTIGEYLALSLEKENPEFLFVLRDFFAFEFDKESDFAQLILSKLQNQKPEDIAFSMELLTAEELPDDDRTKGITFAKAIIKPLPGSKMVEICRCISDDRLFDILEATNFELLRQTINFPIEKLQLEEKIRFFEEIRERKMYLTLCLSIKNIAQLYDLFGEERRKVLVNYLFNAIEIKGLYEALSFKMGTQLCLLQCIAEEHEGILPRVLEGKELNFYEDLVLKAYNAKKEQQEREEQEKQEEQQEREEQEK